MNTTRAYLPQRCKILLLSIRPFSLYSHHNPSTMVRVLKRKASDEAFGADMKRARSRSDSPTNVTCPTGSYASLFLQPARAPAPAPMAATEILEELDGTPPPPPPQLPVPTKQECEEPPVLTDPEELLEKPQKPPKKEEYLAAGKVSYTQWRNERRKQGRRNVNRMLAHLDEILPKPFQSSPSPNGAGGRAIGAQGRSLHDVLNDTVRYISNLKQDSLHKAHGVDKADAVKQSMQSAKSMLCVEVEGGKGDSCTITGMGEGAKSFFKNSPWGDAHGHSLAHFIRCEDLPAFHRLVDASRQSKIDKNNPDGALGAEVPLSMMHFSRMAAVQGQGDGDWPGKARPSQASFMRLPSAFTYDPLLDPCPPGDLGDAPPTPLAPDGKPPRTCGWDASESNADAAVTCSYVPMSMQLHVIPSSEAGTEAGTPIEGPLSVGGEEDAAWKAVVLSPLDVGMGVTTGYCPCCGGGGGTLGGCRRSALMSLSPPMSLSPAMAVAVPAVEPSPACMMPGQPASVASVAPAWPFFAGHGHTTMPFHTVAV